MLSSTYAGTNFSMAQAANVQCAALGNFLTRTAYCAGNPNFTLSAITNGATSYNAAVGDLNRDGKQDLAVVNTNLNNLGVFLGTGTGTF